MKRRLAAPWILILIPIMGSVLACYERAEGDEAEADCDAALVCANVSCGVEPVCGITCGECLATQVCAEGICVPATGGCSRELVCQPGACGPEPTCGIDCGPCPTGQTCQAGVCSAGPSCPQDAQCEALECGVDPVCLTSCGQCDPGQFCADGRCEADPLTCPHSADCGGRECGPDPVCQTSCGNCPDAHSCDEGRCVADPVVCPDEADCEGRECGPDPVCATSCGSCDSGESCEAGTCTLDPPTCPDDAECGARECGPDPVCQTSCGSCEANEECRGGSCVDIGPQCPDEADCSGRECGRDPVCSTSCGECGSQQTCNEGTCSFEDCPSGRIRCAGECIDPTADAQYCGAKDDCEGSNAGDRCGATEECMQGSCTCIPACNDALCGPDPVCGSISCGECEAEERCDGGRCVGDAIDDWVAVRGGRFDGHEIEAFELQRTEATVRQYQACVRTGACSSAATGDNCNAQDGSKFDHPINCVTWGQARTFCAWNGARLPSEWEWEWAARGRDAALAHPWGDAAPSCAVAVINDDQAGCGANGTMPVGSRPDGQSRDGLLDMAGNVWELTSSIPDGDDPDTRTTRGGCWLDQPTAGTTRTDFRGMTTVTRQINYIGFRCARD